MPRSLELYLNDLKESADAIFRFTDGMTRADYDSNDMVQAAVERKFEIIGEALGQMRKHHPVAMQHIEETNKIIAFRNVLAHDYASVDNADVWSAIQSKLAVFREQVIAVLETLKKGNQP